MLDKLWKQNRVLSSKCIFLANLKAQNSKFAFCFSILLVLYVSSATERRYLKNPGMRLYMVPKLIKPSQTPRKGMLFPFL